MMNIFDMLKIVKNNLIRNKTRNILYILVNILFIVLIICFFSAKSSFLQFIDNYLNSDFHFKMIAVNDNTNDSKTIMNKIKATNNKHISKVFENNDFISRTVDLDSGGYVELYGNYTGINYTLDKGTKIENTNEFVCSNIFYPGLYTNSHDKDSYIKMNENIGKKYTISFDKKYVNKEGKTSILKKYEYELKLVGTFDSSVDLVGYNVCYISSDFFEKIQEESLPIYEDLNMEENKYSGLDVLVLVDNYNNVDSLIKEINLIGLNAARYYTLDLSFFDNAITIINIISIVIVISSISCAYFFVKKTILQNRNEIALYQVIGYNSYNIKAIIFTQNCINIILSFVLSILLSGLLVNLANYLLSLDPNYSVLTIKMDYWQSILYILILIISLLIIINSVLKKYFKNISPISLLSGDV